MKTSVKLRKKSAALVTSTDVLDLYLKEISWNLRTMRGQADVLELVILEMKISIANILRGDIAKTSQYPIASVSMSSVAHQVMVPHFEIET